jgi:mono/diheme cytochrome c family protein
MKKKLKWALIAFLSLMLIVLIAGMIILGRFNNRRDKIYTIAVKTSLIPSDSASIARGMHFAPICQSCHGEALEGKVFFEDPKVGKIYSPNLTRGNGGIGANYKDEDWIRALRHGVNPKGNPLLIMPSSDFAAMSETDLLDLIAYLKQIPAVDNSKGANVLPLFTKALLQLGAFGTAFHAEVIDHLAPYPKAPSMGITKEYGAYLLEITGCKACHGPQLQGGKSPDPNSPNVPNITAKGVINTWTSEQFSITMKTGITPEKKALNDKYMPWKHIGQLPENDLKALYTYLMSISN